MTDPNRPDEPGTESGATVAEPSSPAGDAHQHEEGEPKKKLTQKVEIRDTGPCKKHIKVEVDRGGIDERLNEQFSKLVVESNVSGFRPGKAPRKIVEKRF